MDWKLWPGCPEVQAQAFSTALALRPANPQPPALLFVTRITSENVAERFGISRQKQDDFALASQQK